MLSAAAWLVVSQTRAVLERYQASGGHCDEIAESGHSPLIEQSEKFRRALFAFLAAHSGAEDASSNGLCFLCNVVQHTRPEVHCL